MVNHANRGRITGTAKAFAYSRNISDEIAQAIFNLTSDDIEAHRIWEDPTPTEESEVLSEAWRLADPDAETLYWGWSRLRNAP